MHRLLDANVWLPLIWDGHVASASAKEWLATVEDRLMLCRTTQLALLRHITNPAIMGEEVLTNLQAARLVRALLEREHILFCDEPIGSGNLFPRAGESKAPERNRWTDGYLAAFAIQGKYELVTFDRGFRRFERFGLQWRLLEVSP